MEIMNIEFFTFENEVWFRQDSKNFILEESNRDMIKSIIEIMQAFYPEAYTSLQNHYQRLSWNINLQEYRIIKQFCKCNFGNIDMEEIDVDRNKMFHFENVSCPLRGECKMENIVCRPKFNTSLSLAEKRVARLVCKGKSNDDIASTIFISPHTVRNHLRHIFKKLNISSRHELMDYCSKNKLFKRNETEENLQ